MSRKTQTDTEGVHFSYCDSPIGIVEIGASDSAVTSLVFVEKRRPGVTSNAVCDEAKRQVVEYFAGERQEFDLSIELTGTDFQQRVWSKLDAIPFGQTVSYGDVARSIGKPTASRAVGAANGRNPISIILPCHRVIGNDGNLTGYGGGLWRKEWLLKHEGGLLL